MSPATKALLNTAREVVIRLESAERGLRSADAGDRERAVNAVDRARLDLDLAVVAVEVER